MIFWSAFWTHSKPFGHTQSLSDTLRAFWTQLKPFGHTQSLLDTLRAFWTHSEPFGPGKIEHSKAFEHTRRLLDTLGGFTAKILLEIVFFSIEQFCFLIKHVWPTNKATEDDSLVRVETCLQIKLAQNFNFQAGLKNMLVWLYRPTQWKTWRSAISNKLNGSWLDFMCFLNSNDAISEQSMQEK